MEVQKSLCQHVEWEVKDMNYKLEVDVTVHFPSHCLKLMPHGNL